MISIHYWNKVDCVDVVYTHFNRSIRSAVVGSPVVILSFSWTFELLSDGFTQKVFAGSFNIFLCKATGNRSLFTSLQLKIYYNNNQMLLRWIEMTCFRG